MSVLVPALPMTGNQLKSVLDDMSARHVQHLATRAEMQARSDWTEGDVAVCDEGTFVIRTTDGIAPLSGSVVDLPATGAQAWLHPTTPLPTFARLMTDTRPASFFPAGTAITAGATVFLVVPQDDPDFHIETPGGLRLKAMGDRVPLEAFGIVAGEGFNTVMERAITALAATGGTIVGEAGTTYLLTERLDIKLGKVALDFRGATLDARGIDDSAGCAIRLVPDAPWLRNGDFPIVGLRLEGPGSEARMLDGIQIGRPDGMAAGHTAHFGLEGCTVTGFRNGITLGNQTWLNRLRDFTVSNCWSAGMLVDTVTNAGENIALFGGVIHDCRNTTGTAVALRVPKEANPDIQAYGVSFDYCDRLVDLQSGAFAGHGVHLENNNDHPMVSVAHTIGYEGPKFLLTGSVVTGGPFGPVPESPEGRPTFIEVSGDRAMVALRDTAWHRFGNPASALVKVLSGKPTVLLDNVDPQAQGDMTPALCKATSLIRNGSFDEGLAGWSVDRAFAGALNSSLAGAVAGTPGTRPTGWSQRGSLPGGVNFTTNLDFDRSGPRLLLSFTGTPVSGGDFGYYFNGAAAIPTRKGQSWTLSCGVQALKATGVIPNLTVVERGASGEWLESVNDPCPTDPVHHTRRVTRTIANPATAAVQASFCVAFTAGVPVDAIIALDLPKLYLAAAPEPGLSGSQPAPSWRLGIGDTAQTGASALRFDGDGTSPLLYQSLPVTPGRKQLLRGMVMVETHTAGAVSLWAEFRDASDVIVSETRVSTPVSTVASYHQKGAVISVPAGASRMRVGLKSEGFVGTCWLDSLDCWQV
ncbi:hypothetical protein [Maritimibacter sp. DP1N21-5]|uniref:hypothetical protein n=1 Tax=Maritimibacter sp. DP1N21-5 TaxID=2836867 RepID=UPI001C47372F|nr:hypothetical protein [Maritimibacter sp. DP1N21-5]MBV7407500.1 hypothetical protein [Maritimibacter sp. DP1N21-5]